MNKFWAAIKSTYQRLLAKEQHPKLSVPDTSPLSPCIIEPYVLNDEGKEEENKAYMPVSLLIKALDDDRMLNIAVAGNYGVGKSSIINTAEQVVGRKHRFIKISLASLLTQEKKSIHKNTEDENSNEVVNPVDEDSIKKKQEIKEKTPASDQLEAITAKQIEYSILQQILYHDCAQTTPKSRIRRIHKTEKRKPYIIAGLGLLLFVSLVLLLKPSWIELSEYYSLEYSSGWVKALVKWGPLIIISGIFVIICRYCSRHYSFSLSRIGYKNVEMKIVDEMSIFNAYLDEIVYFFESTEYDVVVFEDLDRFVNKDIIFYKLRELNTILNNCQSLDRKMNFVYAVLDHLFDASERVKFFDYIITVIPVINSLNSYNKLKESIQPKELFESLGGNELLNLCEYLQDMRLLLNIVNEYNQFSPLIDRTVMTDKILFGIIVYKNYIPSDFSKMYNKSGIVAGILDNADNCREAIIEEKNGKIEQCRTEIKEIEEEREKKLCELRLQYLEKGKLLSGISSNSLKIRIDDTPYLFDSVVKDPSLFKKVREDNARYMSNSGVLGSLPSFNTVEQNSGGLGHFDKTTAAINNDCSMRLDAKEKKIVALSREIAQLPKTVEGIYSNNTDFLDGELELFKDNEKQDLVKFLILNGYLDRDYQYYISYFYPNSLKLGDRNYVMRAGRREGPQYEAKLVEIDEILKHFRPKNFVDNPSLLNVYLIKALYNQNTNIYQNYRDSICQLISSNHSLDFLIVAYKSEVQVQDSFFLQLLKSYDYWEEINEWNNEEQDILREIYIKFCDLREHKLNSSFLAWLVGNYSFIEKRWSVITEKRVLELFRSYMPDFTRLSLKDTPDSVLNDIIENQRYEISRFNFNAIVKKFGFYNTYKTSAYTSLREFGNEVLLKTVSNNWRVFLKTVFPDSSISEDEAAQLAIINSTLSAHSKYEARFYIAKQRERIIHIESLDERVLDYAFEFSLIAPTWYNVYYYAVEKHKGLPLQFLYKNSFNDKVSDTLTEEKEQNLRQLIVFTDRLKQAKYEEVVPLFTTPFKSIENRIQLSRMRFVISNNLLVFNEENYRIVRDTYGLSSQFIQNNIDIFLEDPSKYPFESKDIVVLLNVLNTKKAKCDLLRAIREIDFMPGADLTSMVKPFIENGDLKVTEVSTQILISIISILPEDTRVSIGRRAILSLPYTKEMVSNILRAMGGDYGRYLTDTTTSSMQYTRDAILIANDLSAKDYIKSCEKKGGKIIIVKK